MAKGNGSTSSNNRMGKMVERVTMVKDKEKRSKDGLASSIVRKTKEVNPRRAKRMEKRGWEYGAAKSTWYR
tara:strand:- start:2647 stop:2859 length:213 start_codon:yes stop_codon:yes gene_type:complete